MSFIYHIAEQKDWEKALNTGKYAPKGFGSEGFIHFSTKDQLLESANTHFAKASDLMVLQVSTRLVAKKLKWEKGRNDEDFPHLYEKLDIDAVQDIILLNRSKNGSWEGI